MTLTVVIPFSSADLTLAGDLIDWIDKLGGCPNNSCLLVADCKLDKEQVKNIAEKAQRAFKRVDLIATPFALASEKWPIGPNWMFETALKALAMTKEPWLWLEPDAVPMKSSWLVDIENAYKACCQRKPFMGQVIRPGLPGLPSEMLSGVAVYPADASKRLLQLVVAHKAKKAFDVATAELVAPLAQHSRLIWNFHGPAQDMPPTFVREVEAGHPKNALPLNAIPPQTVLFHRCKDGSLINLLRGESDASIAQILMAFMAQRQVTAKAKIETPRVKETLFYHVVERHPQRSPDDEIRVTTAVRSWITLYKTGRVIPCHLWDGDYPRSSSTLGDRRHLPYWKDVIAEGLNKCKRPDDAILWTNDDTVLHPGVIDAMTAKLKSAACVGSFRVNFDKVVDASIISDPDKLRQRGERDANGDLRTDLGRDLFAWKKSWLIEHWLEIPDFILGELEFDVVMAVIVRREAGIYTDKRNVAQVMNACELAKGYVLHQKHTRQWTSSEHKDSPAKLHNKRLAIQWYAQSGYPSLISNF
jgi:hypothetical protein